MAAPADLAMRASRRSESRFCAASSSFLRRSSSGDCDVFGNTKAGIGATERGDAGWRPFGGAFIAWGGFAAREDLLRERICASGGGAGGRIGVALGRTLEGALVGAMVVCLYSVYVEAIILGAFWWGKRRLLRKMGWKFFAILDKLLPGR